MQVGDTVRALHKITDTLAGRKYVHAKAGGLGQVVGLSVDGGLIVRWDETVCDVWPEEVTGVYMTVDVAGVKREVR